MIGRIVLIFLLEAVTQAQGATEVQGAIIKGTVILDGEGGPGAVNVQITDSAHTGGPWASDSDGGFTLDYPNRAPGERVRVGVIKEGYVVVNWVQLDLALPKDPNAYPLQIIICKEADREEMARRFYQLKGDEAAEKTYQQKLKALEDENKSDAVTIARLQEERDQAKAPAEKAAAELARNQPGQGSAMYQEAQRLFLAGKIEAAIALLDDEKLRQAAEQAQKTAFRSALEVRTRKQQPQDWAMTQGNLGNALRDQAARTAGTKGAELLAQAVPSLRSAFDVYTREQLPQDWAMTQNNLGAALLEQAMRSDDVKATELLEQAMTPNRGALEVYTREQQPERWAEVQESLGHALTEQAKRTNGREGTKEIVQAVAILKGALTVTARERSPKVWALNQKDLGVALTEQGIRSEGAETVELLGQAAAAFRSCLEVYTTEAFPFYHEQAQAELKECERRLTQPKLQAQ